MTTMNTHKKSGETSFQPYPAYKPSGIDWLGDIPAHWEVRRLKNWLSINQSVLPETTNPGYEFRYLEIGGVGTGVLTDEPSRIRFANAPSRARRIVRAGDTIISTVRTYLKAIWFADEIDDDLVCSTGFTVLTPRKGTVPKFVSYLTQNDFFTDKVTSESVGIAYPAVAESRLSSFRMPIPPLPEQAAIVRYLDRADERIRRAIAAKQRLIDLLTEQRQAVIHRAVTRGIDDRAPMKPSGVEWLGDIPAHWEVRRLRNAVDMRVSNVDKHIKAGELPVRLCNYVDVYKNERITDDMPFMRATATASEIARFRLELGDVLITKDSETWNDIGVPSLVDYAASDLVCGYHVAVLRSLKASLDGRYLHRLLQSSVVGSQFHISANGVTRYGLTHEAIKSVVLPLPPLAEQAAIARHLDKATADIDAAMENARRQVELLREYRARLIADVVTGRVDARRAD